MLKRRKDGSTTSVTTSPSCSNAEDTDGLSVDLNHEGKEVIESFDNHQESNHPNTPIDAVLYLDESLANFEEERVSILEQLKVLEEKLFMLSDEEEQHFEDIKPIEHLFQENGNGYSEICDYSSESNGVANGQYKEMNGKHHQERRNIGAKAKRLLPLFDAIDTESEGILNGHSEGFDSVALQKSVNKFDMNSKKLAVEEEVDHVYERLQALEADREFLKHCMTSLRKGDKCNCSQPHQRRGIAANSTWKSPDILVQGIRPNAMPHFQKNISCGKPSMEGEAPAMASEVKPSCHLYVVRKGLACKAGVIQQRFQCQESQLGLRKKKLHKPAEQPGKKNNLDSKNIQCQRKALDAHAWKSSLLSDLEVGLNDYLDHPPGTLYFKRSATMAVLQHVNQQFLKTMTKLKNCLKSLLKPFKFKSKEGLGEEDMETIAAREQKQFSFDTLVSATKDFHPTHKLGEGGFGPVYKGKLDDGREIAVKKLSHSSNQGKKEFTNEAKLLSRVQHRNVVNLLGYCAHGVEKLLVYEYVAHESLDKLLFMPIYVSAKLNLMNLDFLSQIGVINDFWTFESL
ncbi:hypothetical protein NC653_025232 [Populus alba x Populus x berolinensis]|uniref:Protein kinase domain-containing protein n=1 Tax=Populus alba x Populus x berolinensis TaxID=444605 RepID=A0AAD6MB27_9ROSI|nr:hypothetical protein NC653_025232 [Populus alba x Populus x berolinensis]